MTQSPTTTSSVPRPAPLIAATVFLVALCLRPALTTVGPLLGEIGQDQNLSEGALGLLGTLPLLAFAVISPLVHRVSGRFGAERTIFVALLILAAGTVVRSWTGSTGLWIGTVVIGSAIAVGNVLVPAIVKRDYSRSISRATGSYSAFLTTAAATASAVAVPIAAAGGWRLALGIWSVLAVVVAAAWSVRLRRPAPVVATSTASTAPAVSVWRQPTAWLVTSFMGLQSTIFYVMITWLPTIEGTFGTSAATAGVHLFILQVVGVAGGLLIPSLLNRGHNQVWGTVVASLAVLTGVSGILLAPSLLVVWVIIGGMGQGASLVASLALISLRGRSHGETTQLSGMAQSVGYLLAAAGPVAAGLLAEATGNWRTTLILLVVLALIQLSIAIPAGRERTR